MIQKLLTALFMGAMAWGCSSAADQDFVPLFNGSDLSGWEAPGAAVVDGCLSLSATTSDGSCRWSMGEVDDFALRAEVLVSGAPTQLVCRGPQNLAQPGLVIRPSENWQKVALSATGTVVEASLDGVAQVLPVVSTPAEKHLQGFLGFTVPASGSLKIRILALKRLPLSDGRKKIVLIAGRNSHPLGQHEFEAGISAFRQALDKTPGVIAADYYQGWPADPSAFANADGILLYSDGGGLHPVLQGDRLAQLKALTARGVGFGACHYAVEVPADKAGNDFLAMIGGFYEAKVSANPIWTIAPADLPAVAITHGVTPFSAKDEWYFNIHFRPEMAGVTTVLTGIPSDSVRASKYSGSGPFEHIKAASGRTETLMWTVDNPGANRGFGYTGGHFHANWGNPDIRKLVLNAVLWIAHADLPPNGVDAPLTDAELNGRLRPVPEKKAPEKK